MSFIIRILFCLVAILCSVLFIYFDVSAILAFVFSFIVLLAYWVFVNKIILRKQRKVLDSDCDPERYLQMLDKQEMRYKKEHKRIMSRMAINHAAAHILLGNFQTSKRYLEEIDLSYLSEKDGSYLAYTINMILTYYELGEIEQAEQLYETKLVKLWSYEKRIQKAVEILIGERYYYLQKYDLSYEHLSKIQYYDLTKRQYLGVLFRLAQMDVINGEIEKAIKKFMKVVKHGNKLWIKKVSQEMIENLSKSEKTYSLK